MVHSFPRDILLLLPSVEEIIREIKICSIDNWEFRLAKNGMAYWTSKALKITTQSYPYIAEVKEEISHMRKAMEEVRESPQYKCSPKLPENIHVSEGGPREGIYKKIKEEAKKFINTILSRKMEAGRNEEAFKIYNLAEYFGKTLAKEEILDILFACPFDLNSKPDPLPITEDEQQQVEKKDNNRESESPSASLKNISKPVPSVYDEIKKRREGIIHRISSKKMVPDLSSKIVPQQQESSEPTISLSIFKVSEEGKSIQKKLSLDTKDIKSKMKRKKLVEGIQRREMEKVINKTKTLKRQEDNMKQNPRRLSKTKSMMDLVDEEPKKNNSKIIRRESSSINTNKLISSGSSKHIEVIQEQEVEEDKGVERFGHFSPKPSSSSNGVSENEPSEKLESSIQESPNSNHLDSIHSSAILQEENQTREIEEFKELGPEQSQNSSEIRSIRLMQQSNISEKCDNTLPENEPETQYESSPSQDITKISQIQSPTKILQIQSPKNPPQKIVDYNNSPTMNIEKTKEEKASIIKLKEQKKVVSSFESEVNSTIRVEKVLPIDKTNPTPEKPEEKRSTNNIHDEVQHSSSSEALSKAQSLKQDIPTNRRHIEILSKTEMLTKAEKIKIEIKNQPEKTKDLPEDLIGLNQLVQDILLEEKPIGLSPIPEKCKVPTAKIDNVPQQSDSPKKEIVLTPSKNKGDFPDIAVSPIQPTIKIPLSENIDSIIPEKSDVVSKETTEFPVLISTEQNIKSLHLEKEQEEPKHTGIIPITQQKNITTSKLKLKEIKKVVKSREETPTDNQGKNLKSAENTPLSPNIHEMSEDSSILQNVENIEEEIQATHKKFVSSVVPFYDSNLLPDPHIPSDEDIPVSDIVSYEQAKRKYFISRKNSPSNRYRPKIKVFVSPQRGFTTSSSSRSPHLLLRLNHRTRREKIETTTSENSQKRWFRYYWQTLGNPYDPVDELKFFYTAIPGIIPEHILKMGERINLDFKMNPNLVWIAFHQLCIPSPNSFFETKLGTLKPKDRFDLICSIPIGEHPGDIYFYYLSLIIKNRGQFNKKSSDSGSCFRAWLPFKEFASSSETNVSASSRKL